MNVSIGANIEADFATITRHPTQSDVSTSSASVTSDEAETLWDSIFKAWIDTYEFSFETGAVPFYFCKWRRGLPREKIDQFRIPMSA